MPVPTPVRARLARVNAVSWAISETALKTAISDKPDEADAPRAEPVARLATGDLQRKMGDEERGREEPTVARPTP